jgi:hypothetical protein
MLVNPVVTNRLKGTKYWGAYSAFALKQFSAITMPLVNEERRRKQLEDNSYQVTYDPKTNHFINTTGVPTSTLNSGTPRLALEQLGFMDRGVDRINKYIDLVSPIIKENGGDVTSWLQNAIVRDFNDVQHTGGILELMYNALKDSAISTTDAIKRATGVTKPQGPEDRGSGKGQGSGGGGGFNDGGYAPGENPFQPGSDLNPEHSSLSTEHVKVKEAYGGHRPGRPNKGIRDIATFAAGDSNMSTITFTSGKGDWISPSGRRKGQKTTQHSTGNALDVAGFSSDREMFTWIENAVANGANGVGIYSNGSVHIDQGHERHWNWGSQHYNTILEQAIARGKAKRKKLLAANN